MNAKQNQTICAHLAQEFVCRRTSGLQSLSSWQSSYCLRNKNNVSTAQRGVLRNGKRDKKIQTNLFTIYGSPSGNIYT